VLLSFLDLQRFPVALDVRGSLRLGLPEHMRMPIHQLARESIEDIIDGKCSLLFAHLRIEQHLQEKVAEFARKFLPIAIVDGFQHFVGFFERVGLDGVESLLAIPGAASRGPQPLHDSDRTFKSFAGGGHWESL